MYRVMLVLNALVAILFGVAFMVVPTLSLQQFGMDQYATLKLLVQFFGTALFTVGLLTWFAQSITDPGVQKGVSMALLVGSLAGLVIAVIGAFKGDIRIMSWLPVVIYFIFVLGYAFLLFLQPRMK